MRDHTELCHRISTGVSSHVSPPHAASSFLTTIFHPAMWWVWSYQVYWSGAASSVQSASQHLTIVSCRTRVTINNVNIAAFINITTHTLESRVRSNKQDKKEIPSQAELAAAAVKNTNFVTTAQNMLPHEEVPAPSSYNISSISFIFELSHTSCPGSAFLICMSLLTD